MMYYGFPGVAEILILLLMGSGGGVPLGIPPAEEDPVMSRVAPEECLFYLSWAGMAAPDPNSANHTEQLLAEKEVQHFAMELEKRIVSSIKREAGDDPREAAMVDEVHKVVRTVLTSPTAMFVSKFGFGPNGPDIQGGAVVNLGDRAAEVKAALTKMEAVAFDGEATEAKGQATTWRALPMPEEAPPILWDVKGKYLIVGMGRGEADRIYARARTDMPKWLADLREQLAVERTASVVYVNVADILKTTGPMMGREGMAIVEALGLANVKSLTSVTGLDKTGCVSRSLLATDGDLTGLLSVFAAQPLTKEDLAVIPKDASIAAAVRFDLGKAFNELLNIIERVEPRAREEFLSEMRDVEAAIELKITDDIFASVDDVWRFYNSPGEGGLIATGLTAVVDLRDRDRLVAANGKLVFGSMARAMTERIRQDRRARGAMISQFKHGDQTVFFLNVIGEAFPFAPAWCITEKELVVALFPQNVKAYLSRTMTDSLADVPEVAALFGDGPAPMGVCYHDTPAIFKMAYPVVQILAQMGFGELQREGIDIDVSILPSAASIGRHLRPATATVRQTPAGVMVETRQTLPVTGGGAIALPAFFLGTMSYRVMEAPVAIRGPSHAQAMNNLKQIALAMHNHHDAFKGFPASAGSMRPKQPAVSWRVRILPFIEQQQLYEQYRLDEAWDSENNKRLIAAMPAVYRAPGSRVAAQGRTSYLAVSGDQYAIPTERLGRMADMRDGTSNTLMIVEVSDDRAVPWTKPEDFAPDSNNPVNGLVGLRRGGFLAAFCDGSVQFIPGGVDRATLRALFTRAGGEPIDRSRIQRAPRVYSAGGEADVPAKLERAVPEKIERRPAPPRLKIEERVIEDRPAPPKLDELSLQPAPEIEP